MYLLLLFICSAICFSQNEVFIEAWDYNLWIYYSFESQSEIVINNPENSLDWDIAFKRNHIKTNASPSGIGNAGGYVDESQVWDEELWNSININPFELNFQTDQEVQGGSIPLNGCYCKDTDQIGCENQQSQLTYPFIDCIKNPALDQWGHFIHGGGTDNYPFIIDNHILIIKTSNESFFQFWPTDYYGPNCPGNGGGCITFKYKEICSLEIGDVNKDNQINVADITLSVEYILNNLDLDECQIIASDINEDGMTTVVDIINMVITRILP